MRDLVELGGPLGSRFAPDDSIGVLLKTYRTIRRVAVQPLFRRFGGLLQIQQSTSAFSRTTIPPT
jgi:hypothetical protein